MRLLLGLPSAGSPTAPFLESLSALRLPPDCVGFDRALVTGNFIPAQRELIFEEAVARGFDVLAMIDDDIVFPPDALERLIGVLQQDPRVGIAGALYYSRDGLRPMAVANWQGSDTTTALVPAFGAEPTEVDGVGFGCVVIRVAAIRSLAQPYLSAHVFILRRERRIWVADEDYLFCERLRLADWGVRLHAGVRCKHFDRASGKLIPDRWEDTATTSRPRMFVRTPQGEALIDPDESLPRGQERHRTVTVDYLSVE